MPGHKASQESRREQIVEAAYAVASAHGIDGLTIRGVASRARLSTGLILFHYQSKAQLLVALLDWLLAETLVRPVRGLATIAAASALDRLLLILRLEMQRLSSDPTRIRLLFEFWVRWDRDAEIGTRMRRELAAYRKAFWPIAREVLGSDPRRFAGVTVKGLASLSVSFIKGCAVQAMIDPEGFSIDEHLRAVEGLMGPASRRPRLTAAR